MLTKKLTKLKVHPPNWRAKSCQSGVALIITIILAGIMLASVGLFSKEMLDEAKNSTRLDNSLIAYYAAEAGLEEALLSFRFDRDAEISQEEDSNPDANVTNAANNTPRCVDLDLVTAAGGGAKQYSDCGKNFKERYYAVKMWYKTPSIVNQKILKDDVYEFEVPEMTSDKIVLKWSPNPDTPLADGYRVETTVYDESGIMINAVKNFTCPSDTGTPLILYRADMYSEGAPGRRIVRVKPWYTQYSGDCVGSPPIGATDLEPGGTIPGDSADNKIPFIALNINKAPTTDMIGAPITQIESVGYYGGVARKITAQLDRTTGRIIGIFDFVIYSGSELVK